MTTQLEKMNAESRRLSDLAKDILQDHYACTRVWEAWSFGTMTQDDFISCFDDEDIVADTIASITSIEENARKSAFEKYGIDPSKMSENQLKHLRDYYQAILETVV